ncbi:MAG: thiamine diphosphokinase [Oscillospiraceae bacterium]|nr:thiamine diphosphokinase [Oscillospiraceae bacterium]
MIIAVDGGYLYTQRAGLRADAIVGDFDSLGVVPEHETGGSLVIRLPKEKDQTDMFAALSFGLKKGFKCFHIYGGLGGRLDHTLANIQCLAFLINQGVRGYLHDDNTTATALKSELRLAPREDGVISVFALGGDADGVYLRGLKYELDNVRLTADFPLGVSNEFIGQASYIGAKRGNLLIIYPNGTREI